jgi:hypothetical protein
MMERHTAKSTENLPVLPSTPVKTRPRVNRPAAGPSTGPPAGPPADSPAAPSGDEDYDFKLPRYKKGVRHWE